MAKRRSRRRLKNRIWFGTFGPVAAVPCHWCGRPLRFDEATVDHEPSLAEGGAWDEAVLACYRCNQERGKATCERVRSRPIGWKGEVSMREIHPPWTQEQVDALNAQQQSGTCHPYTCGSGRRTAAAHLDGEGVLVATVDGLVCPFCDYRQDWALAPSAHSPD